MIPSSGDSASDDKDSAVSVVLDELCAQLGRCDMTLKQMKAWVDTLDLNATSEDGKESLQALLKVARYLAKRNE